MAIIGEKKMGKRERHAKKIEERQAVESIEAEASRQPWSKSASPKKLLGFKSAFAWGLRSLLISIRHPIRFGVGHIMMWLAIGLSIALGMLGEWPAKISVVAFMLCLVCGLGGTGEATRAFLRDPKGPWLRPWFSNYSSASRAKSAVLKDAASSALIVGFAFAVGSLQTMLAQGDPEWMLGWSARGISLGSIYIMYLVASLCTAPIEPWRDTLRTLVKLALSPGAFMGLLLFWMVWLALAEVSLTLVLQALIGALGHIDMPRNQLMYFSMAVVMALNAPIMAVSGAFAREGAKASLDRDRLVGAELEAKKQQLTDSKIAALRELDA